jgi:hypothetical protein
MGILRGIFGPNKQQVWEQLCEVVRGSFQDVECNYDRMVATHRGWVITLDDRKESTSNQNGGFDEHIFTRLRAPLQNASSFRFTVYRKGLFSGLGKKLGMQDVEVGHEIFDREFIVKGTDEAKLRQLFAEKRIRDLLMLQPKGNFSINQHNELHFEAHPAIRDVERLRQLLELFSVTLDQLHAMQIITVDSSAA